jgi:hypothetical protein
VKESKKKQNYFEGMENEGISQENEGLRRDLDSVRIGKRGIAKGYLGLQGTGDESGTMDESEKPLPCGEDMESDFRGIEAKPSDFAFQGIERRIAEGETRNAKHGFL